MPRSGRPKTGGNYRPKAKQAADNSALGEPAFQRPPPLDIVDDRAAAQVQATVGPALATYRSRIRIVEAWRYPGSFKDAPAFIDRNWAAYADYDDERRIEAGPALRLPARTPTGEKLARKGDYVVRQQVSLADGVVDDVEIDVWPAEQFERLFMPVQEKPFRPFNPPSPVEPPGELKPQPGDDDDNPGAQLPAAVHPAAATPPTLDASPPLSAGEPTPGGKEDPLPAAGGNGDPRLPPGDEG